MGRAGRRRSSSCPTGRSTRRRSARWSSSSTTSTSAATATASTSCPVQGVTLPRAADRAVGEGRVRRAGERATASGASSRNGCSSCATYDEAVLEAGEYRRARLPVGARVAGPAIIREDLSTTFVCPEQTGRGRPLRRDRDRAGRRMTVPSRAARSRRRRVLCALRLRPLHRHRARQPLRLHRRAHVRPAADGCVLADPARLLRLRRDADRARRSAAG